MKHFLIFAIFLTVQGQVYSRTTEDVLEDFQPIFDEIHTAIGNAQTTSHGESGVQEKQFTQDTFEQKQQTYLQLQRTNEEIQTHQKNILANYSLNESSESIQDCITEQESERTFLTRESNAGTNVCLRLNNNEITKLHGTVEKFYEYQAKLHLDVEDAKKLCAGSKTPLDMQKCLIQDLYFAQKPQVKEMETKLHELLYLNQVFLEKTLSDLKICFSAVIEETVNSKLVIEEKFERCVKLAANIN